MLEEALPVAAGVAVALLPCLAFGGLSAVRGFVILAAEDSGFFKAIEEGKGEEEALKIAGAVASPAEVYKPGMAGAVYLAAQRAAGGLSYGFAARGLRQ